MFDQLYEVGPNEMSYLRKYRVAHLGNPFQHGEWMHVGTIAKTGDDGQPVEIYECRMPARFFRLVALPSANSVGEPLIGFTLSTGSGVEMGHLMVRLGEAIADGMLGFVPEVRS